MSGVKLRHICAVLLAVAVFSVDAMAQTGTGTLRGTMTDDSGAVIPAANVSLTAKESPKPRRLRPTAVTYFRGSLPDSTPSR